MKTLSALLVTLSLVGASIVYANVEVSFMESAPKDRFSIKNSGECVLEEVILEIDLAESAGGLIFDTTASGAGVEVFQPFEVKTGVIELLSAQEVKDGDTMLVLRIPSILPGAAVSFTIDVDDTAPKSQLGAIRITGSEINRSRVSASVGQAAAASAVFGSNSTATVLLPPCPKE